MRFRSKKPDIIAEYIRKNIIVYRALHDRLDARIRMICRNAAQELGDSVQADGQISALPVVNDPARAQSLRQIGRTVFGGQNVCQLPRRLCLHFLPADVKLIL